uniref:Uncharacterized protein n=1 Tax=Pithovirus LCPAC403 TaxID=2506596 RepID=A0A481ZCS8_9VIRU|nr:MAG: hypothetical protein LCPAC403_00740 [Pithovirus LCPAC403]
MNTSSLFYTLLDYKKKKIGDLEKYDEVLSSFYSEASRMMWLKYMNKLVSTIRDCNCDTIISSHDNVFKKILVE